MTTDASRMRVEIGIADIDSYSMLFYGHYLRFNERAANLCLGAESASANASSPSGPSGASGGATQPAV